jgi:hypothetical protein
VQDKDRNTESEKEKEIETEAVMTLEDFIHSSITYLFKEITVMKMINILLFIIITTSTWMRRIGGFLFYHSVWGTFYGTFLIGLVPLFIYFAPRFAGQLLTAIVHDFPYKNEGAFLLSFEWVRYTLKLSYVVLIIYSLFYLFMYLFIYLFIYLFFLIFYILIYLFVYLFACSLSFNYIRFHYGLAGTVTKLHLEMYTGKTLMMISIYRLTFSTLTVYLSDSTVETFNKKFKISFRKILKISKREIKCN